MEKAAVEEVVRKPGRPRDEAVREKIAHAACELVAAVRYARVTCDSIAQRAGADKATIYRWWPNKAAVVIEAFVESVTPELPNQKLGSLEEYVTIAAAQDDAEAEAALISHWMKPRCAVSLKILKAYQGEGEPELMRTWNRCST